MKHRIIAVTDEKVPSVIGMGSDSNTVIGKEARELGLKGRTNTYHFKPTLGKPQDDSLYSARTGKAGQKIPGKPKDYWIKNPDTDKTKTFSPLEATQEYLSQLIPKANVDPQKLIIGEPPLSERWRENYRKNIRQVLRDLDFSEPIFFPEPFAVYQYYRHVEQLIEDTDEQQTVLIVDIGGGTFDCCVIRTTRAGELARSGAHSLPLGVQSIMEAGEAVDIELLKVARKRAKANGIVFKDDPLDRARESAQSLWIVENTKIKLSEAIVEATADGEKTHKELSEQIRLPSGSFHVSEDTIVELNAADLRAVLNKLWSRHWGPALIRCHQDSEKKLETNIESYDIVLLAGGSAQLPYTESFIRKALPNQLQHTKIITGNFAGAAVAQGIAVECKEQAKKRPDLVNDRLVSCLLNDLYIRVGRTKDEKLSPKVRQPDSVSPNSEGLVYRSPGLLEGSRIKCKLDLRHKPRGVLHFWFHGSSTGKDDPLNVISRSIRIPPGTTYVDKKVDLELEIDADGTVTPRFTFTRHGKEPSPVTGQSFNLGAERLEGKIFLGVDFGTSNSYVARFVVPKEKIGEQASYPEYEVSRDTEARLLKIEHRCQELRKHGILSRDKLIKHANNNELDFIFHSNKIEGNKLSRGETKGTLDMAKSTHRSKDEKEAINLRNAYRWVLEEHQICAQSFSTFVREVNRKLLKGIEKNPGALRTIDVKIGGVAYKPPPWGSVDDFMRQLDHEVLGTKDKTSGLELAVRAHTKLVAIHPFVDGNGRTARLLIAATLLAYDLPVLVLNADDKERYLNALEHSNGGSLDSLLVLFMELMEQTLKELEDATEGAGITADAIVDTSSIDVISTEEGETTRPPSEESKTAPVEDTGDTVLNKPDAGKSRKRLLSALKKKGKARIEAQKVAYHAWKNAFEMLRSELSSYTADLDEMEDFRNAGYEVRFSEFDMLTEDGFEKFWTRRNISHTWLCSITICNALECYGLMFQFARCSAELRALEPATAPVTCTLAIGGERTGIWLPVREEPIKLREIGYVNGSLIYLDFNGKLIKIGLKGILDEIITSLLGE